MKRVSIESYLDKGYVELWDLSQSLYKDIVSTVASISYGRDKAKNPDRLVEMLIERGHESPFEFVKYVVKTNNGPIVLNMRNHDEPCSCFERADYNSYVATFKIKIPLFVARQVMRHRRFVFLEKSKRYTKDFPDLYYCEQEAGIMDTDIDTDSIRKDYVRRLDYFKPEIARLCLPVRMYVEMWLQGDYIAWSYFFIERLQKESQRETRDLAMIMLQLLKKYQASLVENIDMFLHDMYTRHVLFSEARQNKYDKIKKLLR